MIYFMFTAQIIYMSLNGNAPNAVIIVLHHGLQTVFVNVWQHAWWHDRWWMDAWRNRTWWYGKRRWRKRCRFHVFMITFIDIKRLYLEHTKNFTILYFARLRFFMNWSSMHNIDLHHLYVVRVSSSRFASFLSKLAFILARMYSHKGTGSLSKRIRDQVCYNALYLLRSLIS